MAGSPLILLTVIPLFVLLLGISMPTNLIAVRSWQAPLAENSLLLDIDRSGSALFAVGERGHVLKSSDGENWQQLNVPTGTLLTAVDFYDDDYGCAVGHDAVIICTWNAGADWRLVYRRPELEAPLLDIIILDPDEIIAIGAYSLYLHSADGGQTWEKLDFRPQESSITSDSVTDHTRYDFTGSYDLHLNAIARTSGGTLYIAAEAGRLYRSSDRGRRWQTLPSPYAGSWFGLLPLHDHILIFGLRGHVYLGSESGQTWRRIVSGTDEHLTAGIQLDNGGILLVGHGGTLLHAERDLRIRPQVYPGRPDFTALSLGIRNKILLTGEAGVRHLRINDLPASRSIQSGKRRNELQ